MSRTRRYLFSIATLALSLLVSAAAIAQQEPIRPGDDAVNPETIQPFHAKYEQMGTPFWLDLRRVDGERPIFSAVMTMQSFLGGLAVDHAGFYADNLGFAYRKTTFGRWGVEYLDIAEQDGEIRMARMSLDADGYGERRWVSERPAGLMFEGTLMYWLLGALPLGQLETLSAATLGWTETGFEESIADFRVEGREEVVVDGVTYNCMVVVTGNDQFDLRNYVAHRPPYLIRQVAVQGDTEQTVIELQSVQSDQ
ncbi:MAG: hypothetical protein GKS06_05365 [Acidobacteria bacterium]|nr:hypothetical protein [Acidobacteriota bacterium]